MSDTSSSSSSMTSIITAGGTLLVGLCLGFDSDFGAAISIGFAELGLVWSVFWVVLGFRW